MMLENKNDMITYIMLNRPKKYRSIDTAIPMQYWKTCDTQLCAYAYYVDGSEGVISLPEVITYINGGIKI